MKWLNALDGTWVDLGPEEFGGVSFGRRISHGGARSLTTEKPGANSLVVEAYRREE